MLRSTCINVGSHGDECDFGIGADLARIAMVGVTISKAVWSPVKGRKKKVNAHKAFRM